jgi:hypothetical protein
MKEKHLRSNHTMLAYILAIAVGLASLALYLSAFFLPEIHRKDDFLWSGVGLFYALVLWICAGRITGGVLLGQAASVSLLLVFQWQTFKLRQAIAHPEKQAALEEFSLTQWIGKRFARKKAAKPVTPTSEAPTPPASESLVEEAVETLTEAAVTPPVPEPPPLVGAQIVAAPEAEAAPERVVPSSETVAQETAEAIATAPETAAQPVQAPKTAPASKSGFSLKNLFGLGKQKAAAKPATITAALDNIEAETEEAEEEWEAETPDLATAAVEEIPTAIEAAEEEAIEAESAWDDILAEAEEDVNLSETESQSEASPSTSVEPEDTQDTTETDEEEATPTAVEAELETETSEAVEEIAPEDKIANLTDLLEVEESEEVQKTPDFSAESATPDNKPD